MKHYIIASHGTFAQGIYSSVEIIIGKQENVQIINGYVDDRDIKEQIQDAIESIPEKDELIVFTDIFGGSVNNEFMKYLSVRSFHLISGMNLALLISVFLDKNENTKEAIKAVLKEVTSSVKYCNEEIEFDSVSEDF
ncbi:MAG: PTS sugar transporter subunit IIA [Erysipelotrichaceae bacterium]|uniref:PTS sugar transporter subunit IIA n=1 Tax=Anaerorhabdus sp. TaxID=1872524 RepID=UPI002FCB6CF6